MPRYGVRFENDPSLTPQDYQELGVQAEGLGYETVWVPEGGGRGFSVIGSAGRIEIVIDARQAYIWHAQAGGPGAGHLSAAPTGLELPQPDSPWPRGAVLVRDLAQAVRTRGATQCDVEQIRRATEIGFAVHESHAAGGGAVTLPVADRTRRIDPRAWGND